jgi:ADP-dependent NAD(P)H-hydrate dehydratase
MSPTRAPSPTESVTITPALLREWALPKPTGGKESRGRLLIIGGSVETAGAVLLAAEAALRSGAGKLQVATVRSVAPLLSLLLPEALVRGLEETCDGGVAARAAEQVVDLVEHADCVLVGPGLADAGQSAALLHAVLPSVRCPLVVDALALAAVTADAACLHPLGGQIVLTPNVSELRQTLHRPTDAPDQDSAGQDAGELAGTARAVVSVGGATSYVVAPDGRRWVDQAGGAGLGVSGSGDVRAGLVAGLVARGAAVDQAAVWAAHLHRRAGERLASTVGPLGFLARELPTQVPAVLAEIEQ